MRNFTLRIQKVFHHSLPTSYKEESINIYVAHIRLYGMTTYVCYTVFKCSLVQISSCCNVESIRDDLYWTSRKSSLELIELPSTIIFCLVQVCSCGNIKSMRDDPHRTSRKSSLELIGLSSTNIVCLVQVCSCGNIGSIRDGPY